MLIGMAAAECSHKEAAGAATGFVGRFTYLGASLSGWPLARVIDVWHWTDVLAVIAIAAGISALLLLPFLHARARAKRDAAHLCCRRVKSWRFSGFHLDAVSASPPADF
ncbi:hypothetical protein ACNKHS_22295 [Shigella flexneri]